MAQSSRPQAGLRPADGDDCGAYTADQWRATLIAHNRSGGMIVTGAAAPPGLPATQLFPNVGVFYATADRLAVTSPGALQISIAVGQALVDGTVYTNDTAITATPITIPAGGANSRIDRVVVRQNYTVADYTSINATGLVVDFNTTRICIISGAEAVGPVAPNLVQDEDRLTYWDIPLAQYEIVHTTGIISNLTDQREWVDAETKQVFIPAIGGWNSTDNSLLDFDTGFGTAGWATRATKSSSIYGYWRVPQNFIGDVNVTVRAVVVNISGGACDIRFSQGASNSTCNEWYETNRSAIAEDTYPLADLLSECIAEFELDGSVAGNPAEAGEIVRIGGNRDGNDVSDTCGDVYVSGWMVEYLGYNRR